MPSQPFTFVTIIGLALVGAGCVDNTPTEAASADAPTDDATDAMAAAPAGPVDLGYLGFQLGPMGDTAVSEVSASLQGIVVEEAVKRVVVVLKIENGATVDFTVEGIDGCEVSMEGPAHVSGLEQSLECNPAPGTYDLTVRHTSGFVVGEATVTGYGQ